MSKCLLALLALFLGFSGFCLANVHTPVIGNVTTRFPLPNSASTVQSLAFVGSHLVVSVQNQNGSGFLPSWDLFLFDPAGPTLIDSEHFELVWLEVVVVSETEFLLLQDPADLSTASQINLIGVTSSGKMYPIKTAYFSPANAPPLYVIQPPSLPASTIYLSSADLWKLDVATLNLTYLGVPGFEPVEGFAVQPATGYLLEASCCHSIAELLAFNLTALKSVASISLPEENNYGLLVNLRDDVLLIQQSSDYLGEADILVGFVSPTLPLQLEPILRIENMRYAWGVSATSKSLFIRGSYYGVSSMIAQVQKGSTIQHPPTLLASVVVNTTVFDNQYTIAANDQYVFIGFFEGILIRYALI